MKTFGVTDYTNLVPLKCCGRTDGRTDRRTDGRSGPTTRPAFAKATQVTKTNTELPETMGSSLNIISTTEPPFLERAAALATWGGGGLNVFYWCQIFTLDLVVVKTQNCLAPMEAS